MRTSKGSSTTDLAKAGGNSSRSGRSSAGAHPMASIGTMYFSRSVATTRLYLKLRSELGRNFTRKCVSMPGATLFPDFFWPLLVISGSTVTKGLCGRRILTRRDTLSLFRRESRATSSECAS